MNPAVTGLDDAVASDVAPAETEVGKDAVTDVEAEAVTDVEAEADGGLGVAGRLDATGAARPSLEPHEARTMKTAAKPTTVLDRIPLLRI